MELPPELKIRAVLTQGGVFKAKLESHRDSYSRYYFVLNSNPESAELLVLSTSTTHFELHRSCPGGNDVHVPLSPQDYAGFTQNCLICCNRPHAVAKQKLEAMLHSQEYEILEPLPPEILIRILKAIKISTVVSRKHKRLVLGDAF